MLEPARPTTFCLQLPSQPVCLQSTRRLYFTPLLLRRHLLYSSLVRGAQKVVSLIEWCIVWDKRRPSRVLCKLLLSSPNPIVFPLNLLYCHFHLIFISENIVICCNFVSDLKREIYQRNCLSFVCPSIHKCDRICVKVIVGKSGFEKRLLFIDNFSWTR